MNLGKNADGIKGEEKDSEKGRGSDKPSANCRRTDADAKPAIVFVIIA